MNKFSSIIAGVCFAIVMSGCSMIGAGSGDQAGIPVNLDGQIAGVDYLTLLAKAADTQYPGASAVLNSIRTPAAAKADKAVWSAPPGYVAFTEVLDTQTNVIDVTGWTTRKGIRPATSTDLPAFNPVVLPDPNVPVGAPDTVDVPADLVKQFEDYLNAQKK